MAELHFALSAFGKRTAGFLSIDLNFETSVAKNMATGEPLGVRIVDIAANGAFEFFVHLLVLLS